jgi:hypothetical protein
MFEILLTTPFEGFDLDIGAFLKHARLAVEKVVADRVELVIERCQKRESKRLNLLCLARLNRSVSKMALSSRAGRRPCARQARIPEVARQLPVAPVRDRPRCDETATSRL